MLKAIVKDVAEQGHRGETDCREEMPNVCRGTTNRMRNQGERSLNIISDVP